MGGESELKFHLRMINERYKSESTARDRLIAHFVKGVFNWCMISAVIVKVKCYFTSPVKRLTRHLNSVSSGNGESQDMVKFVSERSHLLAIKGLTIISSNPRRV